MNDLDFLQRALDVSQQALTMQGYPVGAVIVQSGRVIATAMSNGKQHHDPTSHAETDAIRQACRQLQTRHLKNVTLYTSLEPCLMCFAASLWASIPKIVFACRKSLVSHQHNEGEYDLADLNQFAYRPIQLIHLPQLEQSALTIIENWEHERTSSRIRAHE